MDAKNGDWVQITKIVLKPSERAPQVPNDTKQVPLQMWVKGYLCNPANIGEEVEVITSTGRKVKGELTLVNPAITHDFGKFVPQLLRIRDQVKTMLFGEDKNA